MNFSTTAKANSLWVTGNKNEIILKIAQAAAHHETSYKHKIF